MALEQAGVAFIAQGGDQYIITLNSATKATNTFVQTTEQGSGRISGAGQIIIGGLREMGKIAVDAFAMAGKAAISFIGDSIKVAGDFEQNFNRFRIAAGKGVDTKGLEQFRGLFIQLGRELPVSTNEVEQAAIEMVSGGIDPAIVAGGALRQTLQFAAASGLSLADAAATSAKFLAGWTDSAATTEQKVAFLTESTDALTKAGLASSTNAAELRLGLFNVQGAAQALHAPFTDVVATLGYLAPAFESSAQAGTALNVFMTRLVPQTDKAKGAMQDLGIITKSGQNIFFDAQGGFLGMSNAAEVLKDKLGGMSDEQKISTLHLLFGNDAMKVGNALLQNGAAGLDAFKAKMAEQSGVADAAKIAQEGYAVSLKNALGSVEALQITIGSFLLPVLTDLLNNHIAPLINGITSFAESFMKMVPAIQASDDPLQTFLNALKVAAPQFLDTISGIEHFKDAIVGFATPILNVAIPAINDIAQGIGTLVGWFSTASTKSSDLGGALNQLNGVWQLALKVVQDVGAGYMAIAQAVLPIVQKIWLDHGTEISAFVKTTYDSIIKIITLALQLYDAVVPPILNAIAGFFRDHASEVEKVVSGLGEALGAIVTGTMKTIEGLFQLGLDLIHGDWKAAWTDIQTIVDVQGKAISGIVSGFFAIIAGLFDTSMADIAQTWTDNWNMLVNIATETDWAAVGESVVSGILDGLRSNWNSLTSWVSDKISGLVDTALAAIGAGSPAVEFMPVGEFSVMGIMEGFSGMWPELTSLVSGLGDDLIGQAADIADKVQSAIGDAFSATANIDRQKVANMKAVAGISDAQQARLQQDINTAESTATRLFSDPTQAAAYFKKQSQDLIELAKLRDQVDKEVDPEARRALVAQYVLVAGAQKAEEEALKASMAGKQTPSQEIATMMQKLLANRDLPGILESPVIAQLFSMLQQLTSPPSIAPSSSIGGSTYTQTTNLSMPVYTNNSPDALQQSFAVMSAGLI